MNENEAREYLIRLLLRGGYQGLPVENGKPIKIFAVQLEEDGVPGISVDVTEEIKCVIFNEDWFNTRYK